MSGAPSPTPAAGEPPPVPQKGGFELALRALTRHVVRNAN